MGDNINNDNSLKRKREYENKDNNNNINNDNNSSNKKINNDNNKDIFLMIFRNIQLNKQIFNHLKLYKDNNSKVVYSNKELNDPNILYTDILYYDSNDKLNTNLIPSNIKELKFGIDFERKLKKGDIPFGVLEFTIENSEYDQLIQPGVLPNSIKKITMDGYRQNEINVNTFPESLEELSLDYSGLLLIDSIPSRLVKLNLSCFNNVIECGVLPSTLKYLTLEYPYNTVLVPFALPTSLVYLNMEYFNQPLDKNQIPFSLEKLYLNSFNQDLKEKDLLSSLTDLKLQSFTYPIKDSIIPKSCTSLILKDYKHSFKDYQFPSSIQVLSLEQGYPHSLSEIPQNITHLALGCNYEDTSVLSLIPPNVHTLSLNGLSNSIAVNSLPNTIKTLNYGSSYNKEIIPGSIESVQELTFKVYNLPLKPNVLPSSCKSISFGYWFNQPIDNINIIPPSCTTLSLGGKFNQPLSLDLIPSIKYLNISNKNMKDIINKNNNNIPKSLIITYNKE